MKDDYTNVITSWPAKGTITNLATESRLCWDSSVLVNARWGWNVKCSPPWFCQGSAQRVVFTLRRSLKWALTRSSGSPIPTAEFGPAGTSNMTKDSFFLFGRSRCAALVDLRRNGVYSYLLFPLNLYCMLGSSPSLWTRLNLSADLCSPA